MTILRQNLYKIKGIVLNKISRPIVAKVLEHITACAPAKHPVVHTSGWGACLGNVPTACALLKYSPHVTATLAAMRVGGGAVQPNRRRCRSGIVPRGMVRRWRMTAPIAARVAIIKSCADIGCASFGRTANCSSSCGT